MINEIQVNAPNKANTLVTLVKPTKYDILNLSVGQMAPFSLGWSNVTEITYRGQDINGKWFVCYYVQFGQGATMSHSLKEGEVDRTLDACKYFKSAELDRYDD